MTLLVSFISAILVVDFTLLFCGIPESILSTPAVAVIWVLYIISTSLVDQVRESHPELSFAPVIVGGFLRMAFGLLYVVAVKFLFPVDMWLFIVFFMLKYILILIHEIVFTLKLLNINLEYGKIYRALK